MEGIVKQRILDSIELKEKLVNNEELISVINGLSSCLGATLKQGGKVVLCGNGGSASDALHFASEIVGRFQFDHIPWPALVLNADMATMTAIANDFGYDNVFARQAKAHLKSNDLFIGISTSGDSENVVRAIEVAKDMLPKLENVTHIIHLGACSSTTERDFDYLIHNNFEFTKTLWNYCSEKRASFIYASSAATYGDGSMEFDDRIDIDKLRPLNAYGYSKQIFDQWVKHHADVFPVQHVGLKFFNVYGPDEYFKESMASMVYHGYNQIMADGQIRLFKSCNPKYKDGEQLRDFVYVKDVCSLIMWLINNPGVSGLFNVGTGKAQSFNELAKAFFNALDLALNIHYIDMTEEVKGKYQYYTQAKMDSLREVGYAIKFSTLEEGVSDYVQNYLSRNYEIY
ncbi:MAG: ADP-glyceromanno-heptose 6-epimerase [Lachnospiraceae bacterium]